MSADREVFEVSSRLMEPDSSSRASDPFARMKSFMETRGSVPMGWVRMYFADLPIWNGAYARALKENGGDIAEAVLYADAVVERARAGGAARSLAAVRPGWEPGRLMTMFYSCFSALYNLSARRVAMLDMRRDAAAVYRLATLALPTWFAEPALMGALPGAARAPGMSGTKRTRKTGLPGERRKPFSTPPAWCSTCGKSPRRSPARTPARSPGRTHSIPPCASARGRQGAAGRGRRQGASLRAGNHGTGHGLHHRAGASAS